MVVNEIIAQAVAKYLGFPDPKDENGPMRTMGYGLLIEPDQFILTGQVITDPPIPYAPHLQCYYELTLTVTVADRISSVLTYRPIGNRENICSPGMDDLPHPDMEHLLVAAAASLTMAAQKARLPDDQVLIDLGMNGGSFHRAVEQLIHDAVKSLPLKNTGL